MTLEEYSKNKTAQQNCQTDGNDNTTTENREWMAKSVEIIFEMVVGAPQINLELRFLCDMNGHSPNDLILRMIINQNNNRRHHQMLKRSMTNSINLCTINRKICSVTFEFSKKS